MEDKDIEKMAADASDSIMEIIMNARAIHGNRFADALMFVMFDSLQTVSEHIAVSVGKSLGDGEAPAMFARKMMVFENIVSEDKKVQREFRPLARKIIKSITDGAMKAQS
jgi:hypothetical protein